MKAIASATRPDHVQIRRPHHWLGAIAVLATVLGLASMACSHTTAAADAASRDGGTHPRGAFKIVGYFPSWSRGVAEVEVQWDHLTHVNFAFVVPTRDGRLTPVGDLASLAPLVQAARAHGVPISIAIGGWNDGDDSAFEHIAVHPALRATFARNVAAFVEQHHLDGVDIDWEYPAPGASARGFVALMKDLRAQLAPRKKLLTAALVCHGDNAAGILDGAFATADFFNLMAYDADEGATVPTHHASYEFAQTCLRYWRDRGMPPDKAVLGVPFYGKAPATPYRDLVARDAQAPHKDQVGDIRYDGIASVKRKTALARATGGGIMIWELSNDTSGPTSLLRAISEAATEPLLPRTP